MCLSLARKKGEMGHPSVSADTFETLKNNGQNIGPLGCPISPFFWVRLKHTWYGVQLGSNIRNPKFFRFSSTASFSFFVFKIGKILIYVKKCIFPDRFDIMLNLFGMKIQTQLWNRFCFTTSIFQIIIKLVLILCIFTKWP